MTTIKKTPAHLALADGTIFTGISVGAEGETTGEAVFTTGMTGYQEVLTDPSYCGQIVTMTAPQIGNTGVNDEDPETDRPYLAGFIMRELSPVVSNWRSNLSLHDYLVKHGIVGLAEVDTRALTRHLRDNGAQTGVIGTGDPAALAAAWLAVSAANVKHNHMHRRMFRPTWANLVLDHWLGWLTGTTSTSILSEHNQRHHGHSNSPDDFVRGPIHLVSQGTADIGSLSNEALGGTLNVLLAMRESRARRVVYSSSASIYGNPRYLPINEDDQTNTLSPYSVSKLAGENYCKAFYESYGVSAAVV